MRRSSVWVALVLALPLALASTPVTPVTPVDRLEPTGGSPNDNLLLVGRKFQDVAVLFPNAAPGTGDYGADPCKKRVIQVELGQLPGGPTLEIACEDALFLALLDEINHYFPIPGRAGFIANGDFDGDSAEELLTAAGWKVSGGPDLTFYYDPIDDPTDFRRVPLIPGSGVTIKPGLPFVGSVAVGRRNGDVFDDLIIGLPDATVNNVPRAGAVLEFLGSPTGIGKKPSRIFRRGVNQVPGVPIANERFGSQVDLINFDGVGIDNLLIGNPFSLSGAGVVYIERNDRTFFGQTVSGAGSNFGWAFAPANLNGDNLTDFVIGAPGVNAGPHRNAGVIYGYAGNPTTPTFLQALGAPVSAFGQTTPLAFGAAIEAFDALGSGTDLIFTGTPCFDLAGKKDAGAVIPVTLSGSLFNAIHLDSTNVPGLARKNEWVNLPNGSTALNTDAAMNALCKGN